MSVRSASTPPEVSSCTDLQVVVKRCWPKLWPITPQVGPHISQRPQCRVYLYEVIFFFCFVFDIDEYCSKKKDSSPHSLFVAAFIRVVGSEFVQKYLGEGPRMVRDVFRLAKENAPAIIFIDEIDAIATKRFDAQTGGEEMQLGCQNTH